MFGKGSQNGRVNPNAAMQRFEQTFAMRRNELFKGEGTAQYELFTHTYGSSEFTSDIDITGLNLDIIDFSFTSDEAASYLFLKLVLARTPRMLGRTDTRCAFWVMRMIGCPG